MLCFFSKLLCNNCEMCVKTVIEIKHIVLFKLPKDYFKILRHHSTKHSPNKAT